MSKDSKETTLFGICDPMQKSLQKGRQLVVTFVRSVRTTLARRMFDTNSETRHVCGRKQGRKIEKTFVRIKHKSCQTKLQNKKRPHQSRVTEALIFQCNSQMVEFEETLTMPNRPALNPGQPKIHLLPIPFFSSGHAEKALLQHGPQGSRVGHCDRWSKHCAAYVKQWRSALVH